MRRLLQRRSSAVIRTRRIDLRRLGSRLGVRIVLASDVHARTDWFPRPCVDDLVTTINAVEQVDAVALVGDFVGNDVTAIDWAAESFREIAAPTFATLGNHDHWTDARRIERVLEAAGIPVLTNRSVQLDGGQWLAGIDSCWTRKRSGPGPRPDEAFADVPPGADVVVLGHEPQLATLHQHTLHLAGHTHCGQIRSPFGDWTARLHMPRFSEPYPIRLYEVPVDPDGPAHRTAADRRWIYTTAGVGYSTVDTRVLCPPEIVVVDA